MNNNSVIANLWLCECTSMNPLILPISQWLVQWLATTGKKIQILLAGKKKKGQKTKPMFISYSPFVFHDKMRTKKH